MLERLTDFVCGWCFLTVPAEERTRTFDLMYRSGIRFTREKLSVSGGSTVRLRGKNIAEFRQCADAAGIAYSLGGVRGLPTAGAFFLRRPAIPLGFLLAAVWLLYSTRIIWDVRIEGTEKTDPAEIIALLDELGCGIGDYFPAIDFNDLHARYAAVQQDIAWLSVYMNGTAAEVQVRELWEDERNLPPENVYANVLAGADGVVEEIRVREGEACVKPGDLVRKGQLLISGVLPQKDGSVRFEYAAGEVFCRTAQPISAEIPAKREVRVYTGRETVKKSVKIFKKTINLFINSGTLYANYDKIDTMEQFCPLGLCALPVWCETVTYREYETVLRDVPAEEAAEEALRSLTEQIRTAVVDAELLSKQIRTVFADGVCRMDGLLYLRRDVGRTEEFTASDACVPDAGEALRNRPR